MRIYSVKPDDMIWRQEDVYDIDGVHRWGLPGIHCWHCGETWSDTGIAYPSVALPTDNSEIMQYIDRDPISPEEFDKLRGLIVPLLPVNSFITPGTELGQLVGKVSGSFGDFAWVNPWTLLAKSNVVDQLTAEGLSLPRTVRPELRSKAKAKVNLLEFQIESLVDLLPLSFLANDSTICEVCRRDSRKLDTPIISKAALPKQIDLFRARNFSTLILATEQFLHVVEDNRFNNMLFKEIKVVE